MTLLSEILTTGGGDVGDFKASLNGGPKWLQANGGKAALATYPLLAALCPSVPGTASAPVLANITNPEPTLNTGPQYGSIVRFGGKLCALTQGVYHTSTDDGATWSQGNTLPQTPGGSAQHTTLQVIGDYLFAYSYGGFAWSTDGVTWADNGLNTNQPIKGGALLGGAYYAVHATGTVFRSGSPSVAMIQDAFYGITVRHALGFKGRFVMACDNRVMYFDPASKAFIPVAGFDAARLATDGEFIYSVVINSGDIWRSSDGIAWAKVAGGVAYNGGTEWSLAATPGLLIAMRGKTVRISYDYGVTWSGIAASEEGSEASLLVELQKAFLISYAAWKKITFTRAAPTLFYVPAVESSDPVAKIWIKAK